MRECRNPENEEHCVAEIHAGTTSEHHHFVTLVRSKAFSFIACIFHVAIKSTADVFVGSKRTVTAKEILTILAIIYYTLDISSLAMSSTYGYEYSERLAAFSRLRRSNVPVEKYRRWSSKRCGTGLARLMTEN